MKKLTGIVLGLAFVLCAFSAQMVYAQAQECNTSSECDDEIFCNGLEACVQSAPGEQSVCVSGSDPCSENPEAPICDEETDSCVECLTDDNCTDSVCVDNICVECETPGDCPDDGDPCTGEPVCEDSKCGFSGNPCPPGEICIPFNGAPAAPASQDYICTECVSDDNCTDDLFCNGEEFCSEGTCYSTGDPCDPSNWNSVPADIMLPPPVCDEETDSCVECITDDNCTNEAEPYCVENMCVACRDDEDCDNGLFCDGAETCDNGTCFDGEPPCGDNGPMPTALPFCNEETDQCVECFEDFDCSDNGTPRCDGVMCVECLDDFDCDNGTFCREGVCAEQACDLIIKPRQVRINTMFRPVERRFRITGGEGFDPRGELDFGVIRVRRAVVSKKGVLKVLTTFPAAATRNKGPYEIRVGDCVGEIILR